MSKKSLGFESLWVFFLFLLQIGCFLINIFQLTDVFLLSYFNTFLLTSDKSPTSRSLNSTHFLCRSGGSRVGCDCREGVSWTWRGWASPCCSCGLTMKADLSGSCRELSAPLPYSGITVRGSLLPQGRQTSMSRKTFVG